MRALVFLSRFQSNGDNVDVQLTRILANAFTSITSSYVYPYTLTSCPEVVLRTKLKESPVVLSCILVFVHSVPRKAECFRACMGTVIHSGGTSAAVQVAHLRGRFADFGFSNSWKRAEGGKSFSSGGGLGGERRGIRRRRLGCGREEGVSGAGAFVAVAGSW